MMNIIIYKCLEGFHEKYPDIIGIGAFNDMMQCDFSGENLVAKIIDTDVHWLIMLDTKGFGRGLKYEKATNYREELIIFWNTISKTFDTKNEEEISKLMGLYLWDLEEKELKASYLGVIEEAMKQNKLWKNLIISDIFCSFFGFTKDVPSKTFDEVVDNNGVTKNRVRQLKDESLQNFETDFWFLKDNLIKEKLESLFDLSSLELKHINEQTEQVNKTEGVNFSMEFYIKILSMSLDLVLIGNINDITIMNKMSSKGNVYSNLYLQTQLEHERMDLDGLINVLAIEMHKHQYHFKEDKTIDLLAYSSSALTENEIKRYGFILEAELENEVELLPEKVIIKRNSIITQPEMLEAALRELGGFAYADDIRQKVIEIYPEKNWTMQVLRTSIRGDMFYSVGKSGLFGLHEMRDLRDQMGDGTLNDIIRIYMSQNDTPVHIHELLIHLNNLFPRPKTLRTIDSILSQNSKKYFVKYQGGFYGLVDQDYKTTEFPKIVGGYAKSMRQIIEEANGLDLEYLLETFTVRYNLLEIQVKYLLYTMVETNRISLIDGIYYQYVTPEIQDEDSLETPPDEIDVEIDQDELDSEEMNQPAVSNEIERDAVAQIKIRRGQPRFRQRLLKFYRKTCIVTGCQIPELLEVAYVLPYSEKKDFSLTNGLLLRADIHTLFDLGMIAIDPESKQLKLNRLLRESADYGHLNNIDIGERLTELNEKYQLYEKGLNFRWVAFMELE